MISKLAKICFGPIKNMVRIGVGGCKPFSSPSVNWKIGGSRYCLVNAHEKIHSNKIDFSCIVFNFRSAGSTRKGDVPKGYVVRFPFQLFQNILFPTILLIDFRS